MEHLVVPGKIYLKNPFAKRNAVASHMDGWIGEGRGAYLATCRLAHQEGHAYYYGRNMFYLPAGELTSTLEFFHALDPKHAALISSLGVEIGLFDLTLDMFDALIKPFTDSRESLGFSDWARATTYIVGTVQYTWLKKLNYICDCQGYTEVKVQFGDTAVMLNGQRLANELRELIFWCGISDGVHGYDKHLTQMLGGAMSALRWDLEHILSVDGIDTAREWITRGCPTRLS